MKAFPHLIPLAADVPAWTDAYFQRTRQVVEKFGDATVTYVAFMRRPVLSAPRLALAWLDSVVKAQVTLHFPEGALVPANQPLLTITGPFSHLVELETLLLMKLGPACVAAHNALAMCRALPQVSFLAVDARHCAGTEMAELMAYAASVGSAAARKEVGAIGFIGNATDATASYFGQDKGMGTMPHALVGYAGSTLRAAEMYRATFPDERMTVLVDYFGQEIADALAVCRRFPDALDKGQLAFRLDTHGGRFMEGLDETSSRAVIERHAPQALRQPLSEENQSYLMGPGVSAAAIIHFRQALNAAGFTQAKIVTSSGFTVAKCRAMALAEAPVDIIGTGSYLPEHWRDTYATADIISYNGQKNVKLGREFLTQK